MVAATVHLRRNHRAKGYARSGDRGSDPRAWQLALIALTGCAAVYVLFAGTGPGRRVDAEVVRRDLEGSWEWVARIVGIPLRPSLIAVAAVGLCGLAVLDRRPLDAVRAGVLVAATPLLSRVAGHGLEALDPLGVESARELGAGWYPSGHAAAVMSLGLAAVLVAPAWLRGRWLVVAAGGGPALVGWGMLANYGHHASDVAGGILLATAVAGAVIVGRHSAAQPPCGLPWRGVGLTIAALAAVAALLAVLDDLRVPHSVLQPGAIIAGATVALIALWAVEAFDRAVAADASARGKGPHEPRPSRIRSLRATERVPG